MKDVSARDRSRSIYLLSLALLLVALTFLLGPNVPLLLVGVAGLGTLSILVYFGHRRDQRFK